MIAVEAREGMSRRGARVLARAALVALALAAPMYSLPAQQSPLDTLAARVDTYRW